MHAAKPSFSGPIRMGLPLALLVLLGMPEPLRAQRVPVELEVEVFERRFVTDEILQAQDDAATGMTGAGDTAVEALLTSAGYVYPTRIDPPDAPFMSARSSDDGLYEAGVAGITFRTHNYVARARQTFVVTNPNPVPSAFVHQFEILPMEAAVSFGPAPSQDFGPRSVFAQAVGSFTRILEDGTRLDPEAYFDYSIALDQGADSRFDVIFSPDLGAVLDERMVDSMGNEVPVVASSIQTLPEDPSTATLPILQVQVDSFERELVVAVLEPGESIEILVIANAVLNNDSEYGGLALVGDPFRLDGPPAAPTSSFGFVPVPEPSTSGLLAVASIVVVVARRARQAPRDNG